MLGLQWLVVMTTIEFDGEQPVDADEVEIITAEGTLPAEVKAMAR